MINIFGLAIGMAAALLIYQYANYERNFDRFHHNYKNIYRVTTEWNKDNTPEDRRATTVPWSGPGAKELFSEIEAFSRFAPFHTFTGETWVRYENKKFAEDKIYFADPGFLKIFSFPLIKGNEENALTDRFSIVLTESSAKRYFGNNDPIGKTLTIHTHGNFPQSEFLVTGTMADPPPNSHLTFDFLVSYSSIWPELSNGSTYWHWDYTYCYLLLNKRADAESLQEKMTLQRVNEFGDEFGSWNDRIDFKLQPLTDIHLFSSLKGELRINGDGLSLFFLVIIGCSILLSAYINYINLATVKAVERRTEIGIRKIVGSTKWQLTAQIFVEAVIINVMALLFAILIFIACQPFMVAFIGIESLQVPSELLNTPVILTILIIFLSGMLLSSWYPVLMLTSFRPVEVLGGKRSIKQRNFDLRQSLIVWQFVFCIFFTIGTYTLYQQLQYMKTTDRGMDVNQVLVVKGFGAQLYASYENFKQNLKAYPFIEEVGTSSSAPGEEITNLSLRALVQPREKPGNANELKLITVDADFFNTLRVKFLSGRNFDNSVSDEDAVILNESAAGLLGYKHPDNASNEQLTWGRSIMDEGKPSHILGVIDNYHHLSLRNAHEPLVFIPASRHEWQWNKRYYFIRIRNYADREELQTMIASVEQSWKSVVKDEPFNYFFLDQYYDRHYKADSIFNVLFLIFSAVAILIACLGLFGLVAYSTLQRTKEIGIRKALGASVKNILVLFSKDFVRLMIVASLIAIPIIVPMINWWLSRYAFKIPLTVSLFLIPLCGIFVISIVTVILKSMKVALANPVKSLRSE